MEQAMEIQPGQKAIVLSGADETHFFKNGAEITFVEMWYNKVGYVFKGINPSTGNLICQTLFQNEFQLT